MYSHSSERVNRTGDRDSRSADGGITLSRERERQSGLPNGGPGTASAGMLLQLQRASGNQAAVRMFRSPERTRQPAALIQRMPIVKDGKHRQAEKTDSPDNIIETSKLGLSQRNALVLELQLEGNEELLDLILKDWGSKPPQNEEELDSLFDLADEIASLKEKKPEDDAEERQLKLEEIAGKLTKAKVLIDKERGNPSVQIYRDVVTSLMRDLTKLGGQGISDQAPVELDLQIGPGERADYRAEMRQMGTWAGEAEAEKLAELLNVRASVFVIRGGVFHFVTRIGANGNDAVGNLALVHLGNHYEVVRDVQDGMAKGGQSEWLDTGKTGDCLFESMLLIRNNGKRGKMEQTLKSIQKLRNRVADGLSDAAIDETIQEMLVFGDTAGSGPKTSKLVKERRSDAMAKIKKNREEARNAKIQSAKEAAVVLMDRADIDNRMNGLNELDQLDTYGFEALIDDYLEQRDLDPKSEATFAAYAELSELFQQATIALRRQRGEFDLDFSAYEKDDASEDAVVPPMEAFDRPKDAKSRSEVEAKARERTLARDDIQIQKSPNNKNQHLITVEGTEGEFVMDKIGQLVPRFSRRNISDINVEELKGKHSKEAGLFPSNISPYEDARKSQDARGTGNNKIKNESAEMHHVQGSKPSDYLSVTASSSNALNPKGKEFDATATVVVDLSYIDPENISSLYTSQGMRYFMMDMFEGDSGEAIGKAEQEQRKAAPSSQDMAKKNKELSEKEWQALLDVIRTKEVLISGVIPKAAVEKLKK